MPPSKYSRDLVRSTQYSELPSSIAFGSTALSACSTMIFAASRSVDDQPCQRVTATAYDVYGATGNRVNERKLTVWLDTTSLLIRRVVEDWKPLPGQVNRRTTMIQPMANPLLLDSRFRFVPPGKSH